MDDQTDNRFSQIWNYSTSNRQNILDLQDEVKALHIKIGEQNTKLEMNRVETNNYLQNHIIADLKDKLAEVSRRQAKIADLFTALVTVLGEPTFLRFKKEVEDEQRKV
tara:strand:- start:541 stop:864 length:324 start_codon:yes stop_codon:yes gene_type:complete